ncbi:MAG: hypothetical protein ACE5HE_13475 [Phycisphaerae bacterium]
MTKYYDVGDTIVLIAAFRAKSISVSTANNEPVVTYPDLTDPTTVTLSVEDPSGNVDSYTYAGAGVTQQATGIYYKEVAIDEAGTWQYRWVGTGDCAAAEEGEFEVRTQITA